MTAIVSDLNNESARRHLFLQRRRKALSAPASSVFLTFQLAFRRDFFARLTWLKFSSKMKTLNPLKWFKILCLFCLSRVRSF